MAEGDAALIGAAAGLVGALVGSLSTFQAGRAQWRREARRHTYAELLTAAHDVVHTLEERGRANADENGSAESSTQPGSALRFLAALDAATLLASHKTQWILAQWRDIANPAVKQAPPSAQEWGVYLNRFLSEAKKELRIVSAHRYQQVAIYIGILAFLSLGAAFPPHFGEIYPEVPGVPIDEPYKRSGLVAFYVGVGLLSMTVIYLRRAQLLRMANVYLLSGMVLILAVSFRPTEATAGIYMLTAVGLFLAMGRRWFGLQGPIERWLWTERSVLDDM